MKMMKGMLIALAPAALFSIYLFRLNAVLLIIVGVAAAVASEALYQYISKKPLKINDLSAVVTGLLLALTVSPTLPLYAVAAGSIVGIVIGKQAFGGYGKNILNPALFGRLFIIYAFPGTMSPWLTPIDGLTSATPLQVFREEGTMRPLYDLLIGVIPGSIGETSALLLLIGAVWLIYKKYANWRIPAGVVAAVIIVSLLTGQSILFHLLSGSLILGAFFMATDPITSPKTQPGRYVFGFGVGIIIMAMRLWGWLPEGTTFAIIGMNLLVPLINRYIRLENKKEKKEKKKEKEESG